MTSRSGNRPLVSTAYDREQVLEQLLQQTKIISPPAIALKVVDAASDPDCSIVSISRLLTQDPGLCGKVLKVVNSCVFGFSQPVATIERAVMLLGLNSLRSVVLGVSLPVARSIGGKHKAFRDFWITSVSGAIIARELSVRTKRPAPEQDMIAGLLRDLGRLLIATHFPNVCPLDRPIRSADQLLDPCVQERELIGVSHAEATAALLRDWNLPIDVVEPIRFHHRPSDYTGSRPLIAERAELLHFADLLAQIDTVTEYPDALKHVLTVSETRFGMTSSGLVEFLKIVAPKIEELSSILQLDLADIPDHAGILAAGCEAMVTLTFAQHRQPKVTVPAEAYETIDHTLSHPTEADTMLQHSVKVEPPVFEPFFLESFPKTGCRVGPYLATEILGRGAMGVVLLGTDRLLGRNVAIKMLSPQVAGLPSARVRFMREAQLMASIKHENVVGVYSVGEAGDLPYLAMEFIDGGTLEELLQGVTALPFKEVVSYCQQIASGLQAAHDVGTLHRDLKPANLIIEAITGRLKLTDFGLARGGDDLSVTRDGSLVGSPMYMSPEQVLAKPLDHRSDLFALGTVYYSLAMSRPPFLEESLAMIFRKITDAPVESLRVLRPDLPEWFDRLVLWLLEKNPADRPASAAQVLAILDSQTIPTGNKPTIRR